MTNFVRTFAFCLMTVLISSSASAAANSVEGLIKKPDDWFSGTEGRQALDNILSWQSENGDWPKNQDNSAVPFTGDRTKLRGTFDNGATTGELRVLAKAINVTGNERYRKAFLAGLDHILAAQYANGGWPQSFPLRKGYYTHITFNDNSMIRLMIFLDDVVAFSDFAFVDEDRRDAAREGVRQGIDCIIKCQIVIDGTPTVWCAQHDEVTLLPAKARSYELASLSGAESAGILKYLMTVKNPSPDVIRCVKAGAAWFAASRIEGYRYRRSGSQQNLTPDPEARPLWARFYELNTNRPFFCDRDGVVKYDIEEIGPERRGGYTWYGNWGESLANDYKNWLRQED